MSADLALLRISDGPVDMRLRHPVTKELLNHDDGTPFTIALLSLDHEEVRSTQRKVVDRRQQTSMGLRPTSEQIMDDNITVLVAATKGWNIIADGERPDCTPDEARKLYRKYVWVCEQVDAFVGDRANFFPSMV